MYTNNKDHIISEIKELNKIASETNEIGRNILVKLSEQGEILNNVEEKLEQNEYILSKTFRILRGMTWFGWILNFFTKDIPKKLNSINSIKYNPKENLLINEEIKRGFREIKNNENNKNNENEELLLLENDIKSLHMIGIKIGEALDEHNQSIDRIKYKTDEVIINITDNSYYTLNIT